MKRIKKAVFAALSFLVCTTAIASGRLDPTFADGGGLIMDIHAIAPWVEGNTNTAHDVLVDQEDRTVVVGEVSDTPDSFTRGLVARYLRNGVFDPDFNGGKPATLAWEDRGLALVDVVEQPDGSLLVAGMTGEPPLHFTYIGLPIVCRYLSNGTLDTAFGEQGCRIVNEIDGRPAIEYFQVFEGGNAIALQSDGRIVAMGSAHASDPDDPRSFAVVRLDAAGKIDMNFGDSACNGPAPRCGMMLAPPVFDDSLTPAAIAIDSNDDRIVVAGSLNLPGMDFMAVCVFDVDASKKPSINGFDFSSLVGGAATHKVTAVEVLSDGSVVVAGEAGGAVSVGGVGKLKPDGTVDGSFGAQGRLILEGSYGWASTSIKDIAVQQDGKLVFAGEQTNDSSTWPRVWRVDASSGAMDQRFGEDGVATLALSYDAEHPDPSHHFLNGIATARGRIVVAGKFNMPSGPIVPAVFQLDMDRLFADGFAH